eukprot:658579_1
MNERAANFGFPPVPRFSQHRMHGKAESPPSGPYHHSQWPQPHCAQPGDHSTHVCSWLSPYVGPTNFPPHRPDPNMPELSIPRPFAPGMPHDDFAWFPDGPNGPGDASRRHKTRWGPPLGGQSALSRNPFVSGIRPVGRGSFCRHRPHSHRIIRVCQRSLGSDRVGMAEIPDISDGGAGVLIAHTASIQFTFRIEISRHALDLRRVTDTNPPGPKRSSSRNTPLASSPRTFRPRGALIGTYSRRNRRNGPLNERRLNTRARIVNLPGRPTPRNVSNRAVMSKATTNSARPTGRRPSSVVRAFPRKRAPSVGRMRACSRKRCARGEFKCNTRPI